MEYMFLAGVIILAITDWRNYTLPNYITLPLIILGIGYGIYLGEWKQTLLGFTIAFGIGFICLCLGGMGGGDVKMLGAIGAWMGFEAGMRILLIACVIAFPWGIYKIAKDGKLKEKLKVWKGSLSFLVTGGIIGWIKHLTSLERLPEDGTVPNIAVPFGTCLAIGTLFIYLI
jgi:Flp pilus assembly protein protease CpaA